MIMLRLTYARAAVKERGKTPQNVCYANPYAISRYSPDSIRDPHDTGKTLNCTFVRMSNGDTFMVEESGETICQLVKIATKETLTVDALSAEDL